MSALAAESGLSFAQSGTLVPASLMRPMDAFYERTASVPDEPGILLKSEAMLGRGLPGNPQVWRIQYASTLPDGSSGVTAATVLAPADPPPRLLPGIAREHGTVGILQTCVFSLARTPFAGFPALDRVVAQGWVLVATDYVVNDQDVIPYPRLATTCLTHACSRAGQGRAGQDWSSPVSSGDVGSHAPSRLTA